MNYLLRPRIWPFFLASSGVPSASSGQAHLATTCSNTPRIQHPAVARWHVHLCGLATAIHEISGPGLPKKQKGRVGKNNTGAIRKFYELIIQKAQRLEFTTHLACFVKHEKYYFAKLILPVI
jgi:hypothetical protein